MGLPSTPKALLKSRTTCLRISGGTLPKPLNRRTPHPAPRTPAPAAPRLGPHSKPLDLYSAASPVPLTQVPTQTSGLSVCAGTLPQAANASSPAPAVPPSCTEGFVVSSGLSPPPLVYFRVWWSHFTLCFSASIWASSLSASLLFSLFCPCAHLAWSACDPPSLNFPTSLSLF